MKKIILFSMLAMVGVSYPMMRGSKRTKAEPINKSKEWALVPFGQQSMTFDEARRILGVNSNASAYEIDQAASSKLYSFMGLGMLSAEQERQVEKIQQARHILKEAIVGENFEQSQSQAGGAASSGHTNLGGGQLVVTRTEAQKDTFRKLLQKLNQSERGGFTIDGLYRLWRSKALELKNDPVKLQELNAAFQNFREEQERSAGDRRQAIADAHHQAVMERKRLMEEEEQKRAKLEAELFGDEGRDMMQWKEQYIMMRLPEIAYRVHELQARVAQLVAA